MLGFTQPSMCHKKLLGKDVIRKVTKEISKRLHLKDWENFEVQDFRALMATKIVNDDSVNITESMSSLRHKSAAAHKHCNKTSEISETNRNKVLIIIEKIVMLVLHLTFSSVCALTLNFEIF